MTDNKYLSIKIRIKVLGLNEHLLLEDIVKSYYTSWCKPGDVAIDCGAMHGWHTFELVNAVSPGGHVHAIDALPEHCAFLRARAEEWQKSPLITIHEAALSSIDADAVFIRVPRDTGYSGLQRGWISDDEKVEEISVRTCKLDEIIPRNHYSRTTFIKLDMQGGEYHALLGAHSILTNGRPLVALEWGRKAAAQRYGYSANTLIDFFRDIKYDLYDVLGNPVTAETVDLPHDAVPVEFIAIPHEHKCKAIETWGYEYLMSRLTQLSASGSTAVNLSQGTNMPEMVNMTSVYNNKSVAQTSSVFDNGQSISIITDSSIFDQDFYNAQIGQNALNDQERIEHYLQHGEPQGLMPCPFFEPLWYARRYMVAARTTGALIHYIEHGELLGHKPCPVLDTIWYSTFYNVQLGRASILRHYLLHRKSNKVNPNKYFDVDYYFSHNADVRDAGVDGFYHWVNWGLFEGRLASTIFSADYVWKSYLGNKRSINPFVTFMDIGLDYGWRGIPAATNSVHMAIAANCAPGSLFEELGPEAFVQPSTPKVVAFYLPQYHAIPENDKWWGNGFTEWTNIPRGIPRYVGHVQPKVPRDLGFYSLDSSDNIKRQMTLARRMGVHGFCFYYYNFDGHRLLHRPLDLYIQTAQIDFPFCLMWANENWTRRWDGSESEILIQQTYSPESILVLVDDMARYLQDPRYMCAEDNRPLLFIYRADVIPNCLVTIQIIRDRFRSVHGINPILVMSQSFDAEDPRDFGFDGAIEFPSHKLGAKLPLVNSKMEILDENFSGQIRDYNEIVEVSKSIHDTSYPLIKTCFPSWDNDARRQGKGLSFCNSSPQAFQGWVGSLLEFARRRPFFGERLVFVNAWNEWCEGAYLEPDVHFGYAYLNALARALSPICRSSRKILLVGHDAFPAGAQHLLLNIGRVMSEHFGISLRILLLEGGILEESYGEIGETYIPVPSGDASSQICEFLNRSYRDGWDSVITNTAASAVIVGAIDEIGFKRCSLVHELPTLIRARNLEHSYRKLVNGRGLVVYPSEYVRRALDEEFGTGSGTKKVRPQGLYSRPRFRDDVRASIRSTLGITLQQRVVICVGYADLRKGVDLFLAFAKKLSGDDPGMVFVWVGDADAATISWIKLDCERLQIDNIRFVPYSEDVSGYLQASDLFLLTSREDPFPSVLLEALAVGLPIAAFDQAGGYVDWLRSNPEAGFLLPYADIDRGCSMIRASFTRATDDEDIKAKRRLIVKNQFYFPAYCSYLAKCLDPDFVEVSVIIPNFNYGIHLEERLKSVFSQEMPVYEVILLDDASTDDSVEVAIKVSAEASRHVDIHVNQKNSGNVVKQWKMGLNKSGGKYIWIAEADDSSDRRFLGEMIKRMEENPDANFCFCDSRAVDARGAIIYPNYKGYYRELGDDGLDHDGTFKAKEFMRRFLGARNLVMNVSSVLWRREHLEAVFDRLGEEAFELSGAGDWRIYLESCRVGGEVIYVTYPYNIHRRHNHSVTGAMGRLKQMNEIAHMHRIVEQEFGNDAKLKEEIVVVQRSLLRD